MTIENKLKNGEVYCIGEIGSNHDGDFNKAKELILSIASAGAQAAKLQLFQTEDLVTKDSPHFEEISNLQIPLDWFIELRDFAQSLGIDLFASCFNLHSIQFLNSINVNCHKIASSENMNVKMLSFLSKLEAPVLVSYAMAEWYEIEMSMKILNSNGKDNVYPMHCVANYPLQMADAKLIFIKKLKERFNTYVGFSDHTESTLIGSWAYLLGARIFEKHVTLDKKSAGPDHSYALTPSEFNSYIKNIKDVQLSIGNTNKTYVGDEENGRRRYGTYAIERIPKGTKISDVEIEHRHPRRGIPANIFHLFKDLSATVDIEIGEPIQIWHLS